MHILLFTSLSPTYNLLIITRSKFILYTFSYNSQKKYSASEFEIKNVGGYFKKVRN